MKVTFFKGVYFTLKFFKYGGNYDRDKNGTSSTTT